MANRFTDSRKWDDPWFRKLPCKYKAFFMFLLDKCNHAGIWKVDFESAEFHIGESMIKDEVLKVMDGRIIELKEKWFIPKFINFQYQVNGPENLNPDNRVHKSVIDLLTKEGAYKGLIRGVQGCIYTDKDKDKDKDVIIDKVKLYKNEYINLINIYGLSTIKKYIEDLNIYAAQKPKKFKEYASHYATIRAWMRRDGVKNLPPKPQAPKEELHHDPKVAELIHKAAQEIGAKVGK